MGELSGCDPVAAVQARQQSSSVHTRVVNMRDSSIRPTDDYVYIGRGSKWGNPFTHLYSGISRDTTVVGSREEAIERYEEWLKTQPDLMAALPELRGKTLMCYCRPAACHGDVLARLADGL
jgi:hypothetical protein